MKRGTRDSRTGKSRVSGVRPSGHRILVWMTSWVSLGYFLGITLTLRFLICKTASPQLAPGA